MQENWISLIEYSNKYKVSISTLRRKIKADEAEYLFDEGKYYLKDIDPKLSLKKEKDKKVAKAAAAIQAPIQQVVEEPIAPSLKELEAKKFEATDATFKTANRLLEELKKAYSFILQEKEDQILQLKGEIGDLKTLVRVLEDEVLKCKTK